MDGWMDGWVDSRPAGVSSSDVYIYIILYLEDPVVPNYRRLAKQQ